jgi:hypothetical protein
VFFIGQDDQLCYMAIEFIDGVSLREVIDRQAALQQPIQTSDSVFQVRSPGECEHRAMRFDQPTEMYISGVTSGGEETDPGSLTPEACRLIASRSYIRRCCEIVRDVASSLAHAHDRGVVHRDIKPENLMLDRQGRLHVIDFGIARFFEDVTLTNTGALVGTPMYMSPEQVTARFAIDHRTDIYSLGLVLYELLTLRRPIRAPTREGILRQIVTKPLLPVSRLNRAVPRDLEALVHMATAKDPDERYQTASDFATDLRNHLEGTPVTATPFRYKFDAREVITVRPADVTLAGLWVLFASLYSLLGGLGGLWADVIQRGLGLVKSERPYMLSLGVLYAFVGRGLLLGQRWARWVGIAACAYGICRFGADIYRLVVSPSNLIGSSRFSIEVTVVLFWAATLVILIRRRTGDWFRFAERLRSEHEQHKASPG